MDWDKNKGRLVLSSHTGKIKLFHLEKNGTNYFRWGLRTLMNNYRDTNCIMEQELEWSPGGERCNPTVRSVYGKGRERCDIWTGIWYDVGVIKFEQKKRFT